MKFITMILVTTIFYTFINFKKNKCYNRTKKGGDKMIRTLVKIRYDTQDIVLSSPCFFNENELERMGITLNQPFEQKGIIYKYKLLGD